MKNLVRQVLDQVPKINNYRKFRSNWYPERPTSIPNTVSLVPVHHLCTWCNTGCTIRSLWHELSTLILHLILKLSLILQKLRWWEPDTTLGYQRAWIPNSNFYFCNQENLDYNPNYVRSSRKNLNVIISGFHVWFILEVGEPDFCTMNDPLVNFYFPFNFPFFQKYNFCVCRL